MRQGSNISDPHSRQGFWLDLDTRKRIRLDYLPNLGVYAVFDVPPSPFQNASRLFIARTPGELAQKLSRARRTKALRSNRVYVEAAVSEADITEPGYEQLVWTVLAGIEQIKSRGDKAALRRIRAALERKGLRPGPRRQDYATKWKIETLRNLSTGVSFENAVTHPARKRALDSARQELWEYCQEFYRWCLLADQHSPGEWQNPKAGRHFREEFGMEFPRDRDAAAEAYRRGKRTVDRTLAAYDHFLKSKKRTHS